MALLLGGCAKVNDTGLRLVSTNTSAYLQLNGQKLEGNVLLVPDRTGRVSFASEAGADAASIANCSGAMRYTATYSAEVDLHCSDGTQVALQMTLVSETRGYGYGRTSQGPASMAFGLPEADARAFMGRATQPAPAQTP
jgi:hypothetical protein